MSSSFLSQLLSTDIDNDDALLQSVNEQDQNVASSSSETFHTEPLTTVPKGVCVECEDEKSVFSCVECMDDFCQQCFEIQHRKGNRAKHTKVQNTEELTAEHQETHEDEFVDTEMESAKDEKSETVETDSEDSDDDTSSSGYGFSSLYKRFGSYSYGGGYGRSRKKNPTRELKALGDTLPLSEWWEEAPETSYFQHRSKFCPIRIPIAERRLMRIIKAIVKASCHHDHTELMDPQKKSKRSLLLLKDICACLCGTMTTCNAKAGKDLLEDNDFESCKGGFQYIFELGRRHKIRNPEKMRTAYGKMIYLLQDAVQVQDLLGFSPIKSVRTVYDVLKTNDCLELLNDKYLPLATMEIIPDGKTRVEIDVELKNKENAISHIAKKYATEEFKEDAVKMCVFSICDNHGYLRYTRDPCNFVLQMLDQFFSEEEPNDKRFSLAIQAKDGGARLTHTHADQYHFAKQTLTLWKEILHNMYELWYLSELDLLDENSTYTLKDTGQGIQRVQACPRVGKKMRDLLYNCQKKLGSWIGSSVIHLGDNNVPNALMFIDKYNQIPRILLPISTCLRKLPEVYNKKPDVAFYINQNFGTLEDCYKSILSDFFRHAFDGSGADNFYAAGSCIDGRLTSAWNWCSQINKKKFYHLFLITGFVGFDGKFFEDE